MTRDVKDLLLRPTHSLREAMTTIDESGLGIVLVVDEEGHFLNTITDGDIRRAILAGIKRSQSVADVLEMKDKRDPITALAGTSDAQIHQILRDNGINHLPLVDEDQKPVDLRTTFDLVATETLPMNAVIMAGGFGKRMGNLTSNLPKPMLPLGDRSILEHIIVRLERAGVKRVNITTHYLPEKIKDHFGDGQEFGVDLTYIDEENPLGTAGSLSHIEASTEPLLVINGDIFTEVSFRDLLAFHKKYDAMATVGVRQFDLKVPYGVVETTGVQVDRVVEKPEIEFLVAAGIYVLDPEVSRHVLNNQYMDMPDLINLLLKLGKTVVNFPVVEYWLDMGKPADYEQGKKDALRRKRL